jgi:hypothetical protein
VPQPVIEILVIARSTIFVDLEFRASCDVVRFVDAPASVSLTTFGCSKISLSMKCLKPLFSADDRFPQIWRTSRSIGLPSKPVSVAVARTSTTSPSSQDDLLARVLQDRRNVGGDEHLALADADDSGARAVTREDQPVRRVRRDHAERERAAHLAERVPDRGDRVALVVRSSRCASTSVSVSLANVWPSAISCARRPA